MRKTALLLIAHGSRQPEANGDLHALAQSLHGGGAFHAVVASFLELARPTIAEGGRECVALGAERVVLAPYFLSAGRHVREDLQAARAELALEFAAVEFLLAEPLGPHPLLERIILERAQTVLQASRTA